MPHDFPGDGLSTNMEIAKALDLVVHMICVLADGGKPSQHDLTVVAELIKDIRDRQ